jgi:hypothetical protein
MLPGLLFFQPSPVPEVDAGAINGGAWETYTCVSGGFATSFPHPPQESTSTSESGVRTDRVMCRDAQSGLQYVVYCHHLSDGLGKSLPTSKDRLDRFRAVLLAKHTLTDERANP